jgi:hypothetical protein
MVAEVLPTIGEIADPVVQAHYLQRLSRLGRVSEDALRRQMRAGRNRTGSQSGNRAIGQGLSEEVQRGSKREEYCLALLLKAPPLADKGAALDEGLFSLSENREIFRRWLAHESVSEEEEGLWEHFQEVLQTDTPQIDMGKADEAFLHCVALLEDSRMRAVKEASALALAEEEVGVRPGQVATVAWQKLAGQSEEQADYAVESAAAMLLEDMRAGQRYHRQRTEGPNPGEAGTD